MSDEYEGIPIEVHVRPDSLLGRAEAAEARVAELEAKGRTLAEIDATYQTELGHRCAAAEAERDRLRDGITALADEWDTNAQGVKRSNIVARAAFYGCAIQARQLLCPPSADTEEQG